MKAGFAILPFLTLVACTPVIESPVGGVRTQSGTIEKHFQVLAGSDSDAFYPIHPNPFSRGTGDQTVTIEFSLADSARAVVLIQNPIGEEIVRFSDSTLRPGYYKGEWDPLDADGNALSAGLYFVTVNIRNASVVNPSRPNYIQSRMLQILNN